MERKKESVVTTSLRLPESKNEYIREKAAEMGVPQHAFTVVLIDLGIKMYEGKVSITLRSEE